MQRLTERFHFVDLRAPGTLMTAEKHVFIRTFQDWHPTAEIVVWTYEKIRDEGHAVPAQFFAETDPRAQKDILFYWICATQFGTCCDTDVICLGNWDKWAEGKEAFIAQFEEARVGVTNAILGSLPANTFYPDLLALLPGLAMVYKHAPFPARTGSQIMYQLLAGGDDGDDKEHPVTLAEPDLFCPYKMSQSAKGEVPNLEALKDGSSLAVHLWASSADSKTYAELAQRMMNALGYSNFQFGQQIEKLPDIGAGDAA